MFTGIVEEVGKVASVPSRGSAGRMRVESRKCSGDLPLGGSIAVEGVCLTVVARGEGWFEVEMLRETIDRTTLQTLRPGSAVNLERPLGAAAPLGGHFVLGHVDGTGRILSRGARGEDTVFEVEAPQALALYLVPKGSIALDGVSLTLATVSGSRFAVHLIPHTLANTTLGFKRAGDGVNIEGDILGKYVERFLRGRFSTGGGGLTEETLRRHGF